MPPSSPKVRLFTIKTAQFLMTILFLFLIYALSRQAAALVLASSASAQAAPPTVVIDSGHGGNDPGKIGVDGTLEKDLNLTIARKLKYYLEASGVQVVMTRDSDNGLYKETDSHKKTADLKARCQLINDTSPALTISIHQNSLPSSPVTHGAQTFWNRQEGAEALARTLQAGLNPVVNTHRAKEPKPIPDSIYLMNHVDAPAVLVECGFLSNEEETARLRQGAYQTKLAAAIAAGYLQWAVGEGTV